MDCPICGKEMKYYYLEGYYCSDCDFWQLDGD